ncbi:MAG: hypothetical protein C0465_26590 [Ralstonia sp.]|uniref:hypothetical protein n=1 Tax=Ralstonia sp. TaxID=54061 RepID=UPI00257D9F81|nr:hypothetical protein [Ralstonia sp.]MBA4234144.1 hypothetical protein [Ralstonia sp.]
MALSLEKTVEVTVPLAGGGLVFRVELWQSLPKTLDRTATYNTRVFRLDLYRVEPRHCTGGLTVADIELFVLDRELSQEDIRADGCDAAMQIALTHLGESLGVQLP